MEKYIVRDLESKIINNLKSKEIIAVVGPRRCGKTTLVQNILKNYSGKVNEISFDDLKILKLFEEDIDEFIDVHINGYDLVFIDEVHYSKDSGKKLKYIHDLHWTKIIISGSSAAELSINSLKYLVGRIFIFNLYPFSFKEFLRTKDKKYIKYFGRKKISSVILEKLNQYLEEYLIYGGYPRVVLAKTKEEKIKILEGIFNTYLLKEIKEILHLSEDYKVINLIKALSLQVGNIINYSEISNLTEFNYLDLKKYINILEKTFILKQIRPYFTNKRTEIAKSPKIYFYDTGFRNVAINNFQKDRPDKGSIYENFIFGEILREKRDIKYWNSRSKAEVDFVLEEEGKTIPIEIKSKLINNKITNSFRSFINKYNCEKGYFFSIDYFGETKINKTKIAFIPFVGFNLS